MLKVNKVNQAVLVAMSAGAATSAVHAQAIEEITVTATKRTASMQDVPLAVQAMDTKALAEQNIQSFSDYVKFLPSVNAGGRGPGQNEIYIRGAAVDAINITVAESQGSAPNVALYLDEQPVTSGGRNLDVYVTDMERIEVLPGPQGTLYGASSMAGTVRLITNKPNVDEFQASWSGSYARTDGGEASNNMEAMINIPLVEGKMAFRAALYNDNQGGYIDNVPGTIVGDPAKNPTFPGKSVQYDPGTIFFNGTSVPDWDVATTYDRVNGVASITKTGDALIVPVVKQVATNDATIEDDFNDAHYAGARFGLKWNLNDNWDLLVQNTQQSLKTEGVWDYDQAKGDLKVSRFTPDKLDDTFSQTAWTLSGSIGDIDLVYTGAYLDRSVEQQLDYTGYINIGKSISGYQCEYLTGAGYYTGAGVGETLQVGVEGDVEGEINPGVDANGDAYTTAAKADYVAPVNTVTTRYTWDPTLSGNPNVIECGDPRSAAMIQNEMTRMTNELRFNTNWDGIVNLQGGVFVEDFEIKHIGDFNYHASYQAGWNPIDINSSSTFANSAANARGVKSAATQFRNDNLREEQQVAIFGEANFQLSDELNVAVGARQYDLDYDFQGYGAWRYGNRPLLVDDGDPSNDVRPNVTGGRDYASQFASLRPLNTEDTMMKFTVSFTPSDDTLFYASWSEGYRPGGFNRAAAKYGKYDPTKNNMGNAKGVKGTPFSCGVNAAFDTNAKTGFPGICIQYAFRSDTMENTEFGWKTMLMDGRLRFNGSIYFIEWKDIQVSQFDSQNISILTVVDNGGDAEISGMEGDLVYAMTDNFTLHSAFSFNNTELTRVDPGFAPIVQDEGRELPLTPETQFSVRGRYEWETTNGDAYAQLGIKHASKALNSIVDTPSEPNTYQKAYTIVDAATGINNIRDNWGMELYIQNLGDERAQLHINRQDFFERVTVNRPRTVGLRISYDF